MKLLGTAIIASLAGLALGAGNEAAQVYLLRSRPQSPSSRPAEVPRQIARHIIFQRLGVDHESLLGDLPDGVDAEVAVELLRDYGRKQPSLFAEVQPWPTEGTAQGVLIVEGVKPRHVKTLVASLPASMKQPAFVIRDPPSTKAVRDLVNVEVQSAGISTSTCGIEDISNLYDAKCWPSGAHLSLYDLETSPELVGVLAAELGALATQAEKGVVEMMLVFLPESSRDSPIAHWTTTPRPIARRAAGSESVMTEDDVPGAKASAAPANKFVDTHDFVPLKAKIPACFQSSNSCMTQTHNCSGHGRCLDKYASSANEGSVRRADDDTPVLVCFVCHCTSTLNRPEGEGGLSTTHWAGNMCQKRDISVEFWMITIFSVFIIGALTFAVGMLFSVGEEKLPGVIGAGVSKAR